MPVVTVQGKTSIVRIYCNCHVIIIAITVFLGQYDRTMPFLFCDVHSAVVQELIIRSLLFKRECMTRVNNVL